MQFKSILTKLSVTAIILTGFATALKGQQQPAAYTSGIKKSYVRVWDTERPLTDPAQVMSNTNVAEVKQTTQYVDGLGRPIQTIAKKMSSLQKDMVAAIIYDEYGREKLQFLPFVSTQTTGGTEVTNDGLFKMNPFQQQAAFYKTDYVNSPINGQGEIYFYNEYDFETSPLDRVTKAKGPGNSWVGSMKGIESTYDINEVNEIRTWNITTTTGSGLVLPTDGGWYASGKLYRLITKDEHGKRVVEYKNNEGKIILKKVEIKHDGAAVITSHTGWLCTYYVYDYLNNLRFVIPPKAVEALQLSWSFGTTVFNSSDIAKELCFYYGYDERNRLIVKKVPGAGEAYMVYDARDRLVMMQDANMRAAPNKWMVTKYDGMNRSIETGLWVSSTPVATHHSNAFSSISYPITSSGYELYTETHYDDYTGIPSGLTADLHSSVNYTSSANFITPYNTSPLYAQQIARSFTVKGMATWTRIKVLGSSNTFISSVMIYDDRGRMIQVQSINKTGGLDIVTTQYDYSGKPLRTHQKAQKLGGTVHSYELLTSLEYDQANRLKKIKKKLTNNTTVYPEKTIVENSYDELGQLKTKKLSPNIGAMGAAGPLETLTYDYNIRGWMLGMNRSYLTAPGQSGITRFGFELGYDKLGNNASRNFTAAQYNGNINGMVWKSDGDDVRRKYDFRYDAANRLLQGIFEQDDATSSWNSTTMNYELKMGDGTNPTIAYDANGNIKAMTQYGWKITAPASPIDNLTYTYNANSNKLQAVSDAVTTDNKLGDFTNKNTTTTDYGYDKNGNLITDLNKRMNGSIGIDLTSGGAITYNYLNLLEVINVKKDDGTAKGTITYTYDATGNKLQKVVAEIGQPVKTTLYLGGAVYENDIMQFIAHEEGRMRVDVSNTTTPNPYDYFIKDHLGNVRMVLTDEVKSNAYITLNFENDNTSTTTVNELNEQNAQWENASGTSINVAGVRTGGVTNFNSTTGNGSYIRMIKRSTGAIGAAKLLKVMAGDRIHTKVDYYYTTTNSSTNNGAANPLNSFVNSLISVFGVNVQVSPLLKNDAATVNSQLSVNTAFTTMINPSPSTSGANQAPKAYLNILFFDDQFKFDANSSVVVKVAYAVNSKQTIDRMFSNALTAQKSGYVYIYFSNESETQVYFDNFILTHERGSLTEETHYYPFGLTMAGINSQALTVGNPQNKYKFNGIEQNNDFDLNMYDAFYRNLDPQVGRFWQVDPKPNEMVSQYAAMLNNPIRFSDPLGDTTWVYNQNGVFVGVVNDKLKNQVHYIKTDGDPTAAWDASTLSTKQANALGKTLRNVSIAYIGSNSVKSLKGILNDPKNTGLEALFVGKIGANKEITFTQVDVPDEYRSINSISTPPGADPKGGQYWINKAFTREEQANLFMVGHTHTKEQFDIYHNNKFTGKTVFKNDFERLKAWAEPSGGGDYNTANFHRKSIPQTIATGIGVSLYTQGHAVHQNGGYFLYKQFK